MNKLLAANFMCLRKNKCFWAGMVLMLAVGIYLPVMRYISAKSDGFIYNVDTCLCFCAVFAPIVLSVFCSLFVGTEYSDGTLRNKIMVGHQRLFIYLAGLLVNMAAALLLCAVFFITYLCVGIPLLGFFETEPRIVLLFVLAVLVLCITCTSIYNMISILCNSKAVSAVICILCVFIMLMAGSYINSRLQEPETYPGYTYEINGEVQSQEEEKNPHYLKGTERKVYEFLYDFLPGGQMVQCSVMEAENPLLLVGYSVTILVVTTFGGIVLFRKKNIA